MKTLKKYSVEIILVIIIITGLLLLCSCKATYHPARKIWNCESIYQELGRYDTCQTIKENWIKGTTTIVHLHDDSCVVIWGKKCEFERGELLFAKGEYWASIHTCKYFLVNEQESLRYTLLDRK